MRGWGHLLLSGYVVLSLGGCGGKKKEAKEFANHLAEGKAFMDILGEMQVPDITVRPARGGAFYHESLTLTRARVLAFTGENLFDDIRQFQPEEVVGPYHNFGLTHYFLIKDKLETYTIPFNDVNDQIRFQLESQNHIETLENLCSR